MIESVHPIRVVAQRTGMSPHLIRMWERRYGAIVPGRTATGRRLYSDEDIERLILLRRATEEGESIGQIAGLAREELLELVPRREDSPAAEDQARSGHKADRHLTLCLQSMKNLDPAGLETRLLRASVELGQRDFMEKLLHPLLELTGEMWSDGRLEVTHEHLASTIVRSLLGSMYLANTAEPLDPLLISTTPSGQYHEFGALMACATAAAGGWRTLYLGRNLPAQDIVSAAHNRRARAIALSLVYPDDDPNMADYLRRLAGLKPDGVALLVGGRAAAAYDSALNEIGAVRLASMSDLREALAKLRTSNPKLSSSGSK